MSQDISHVLEGWDFDPHELNVRIIVANDGSERLQLRIDLGLLQMAVDGRPDGARPNGYDSYLEYYESCAERYGTGYQLSDEALDELFRERWQYCQRYLCFYHLGRYEQVVADTERTLRLHAFVRAHARRKRDQWRFDQYRPYVIMMNTRARAMIALQASDRERALAEIDEGRRLILAFLRESQRSPDEYESFELDFLSRWHNEIKTLAAEPGAPAESVVGDVADMWSSLQKAVQREDYEYAALIRDRIKQLEQTQLPAQE
jgi:hypothetical protein